MWQKRNETSDLLLLPLLLLLSTTYPLPGSACQASSSRAAVLYARWDGALETAEKSSSTSLANGRMDHISSSRQCKSRSSSSLTCSAPQTPCPNPKPPKAVDSHLACLGALVWWPRRPVRDLASIDFNFLILPFRSGRRLRPIDPLVAQHPACLRTTVLLAWCVQDTR